MSGRIQELVDSGAFYEAHQLCLSLHKRYEYSDGRLEKQGKHSEAFQLLVKTMHSLSLARQYSSVLDLLGSLLQTSKSFDLLQQKDLLEVALSIQDSSVAVRFLTQLRHKAEESEIFSHFLGLTLIESMHVSNVDGELENGSLALYQAHYDVSFQTILSLKLNSNAAASLIALCLADKNISHAWQIFNSQFGQCKKSNVWQDASGDVTLVNYADAMANFCQLLILAVKRNSAPLVQLTCSYYEAQLGNDVDSGNLMSSVKKLKKSIGIQSPSSQNSNPMMDSLLKMFSAPSEHGKVISDDVD